MFEKQTLGKKDLKFSVIEGFFATILLSASVAFIVPFAIFLGANSLEIGFLAAFPAFFAAILQLFSTRILSFFKKRKTMVIFFCFLQVLFFLPIAFLPIFFKTSQVTWLIIFYSISLILGSQASPVWQSWMKSIIPNQIIGSFFGFRNAIVSVASFIFLLLFGFSLKLFEADIGVVFLGIFLIGVIGRIISVLFFFKIDEPKKLETFEIKTRFLGFVKNIKKNKLGYFILYGSLMAFGISLTNPFVSFHYLENLGLKNDYFVYTLLISIAMVANIIGMLYWGKIINKFGSRKILKATSKIVVFFPILYILFRNPIPLVFVQLFDGMLFSGYNLAIATFVYDYADSKKIIRFGTYQAIFFGTAIFFGALISGFIQTIPINFYFISNSFYLLCLISIIVRGIVFKKLFKRVQEVKRVEYIQTKKLVYSILSFEPLTSIIPKTIVFSEQIKTINISLEKRLNAINQIINNQSTKLTKQFDANIITKNEEKNITKKPEKIITEQEKIEIEK